jgi:hypothetical protein
VATQTEGQSADRFVLSFPECSGLRQKLPIGRVRQVLKQPE